MLNQDWCQEQAQNPKVQTKNIDGYSKQIEQSPPQNAILTLSKVDRTPLT